MAAVDYARLREDLLRSRLLFVAHRNEILDQSLATFRYALRDASFGEKWIGGSRPQRFEHVFASIQSLNAANFDDLAPDHFDVVIVDEFHHAAAPSYRKLLDHVEPEELLGLTATPERSDDLSILHWFDDRIAAELRLWDAIDQQRLSPFMYFGIHDGLDLTDIPWRRGQGYDIEALSNLYTSSDAWARIVLQEVLRLADDPGTMRALGFCVSIDHAQFMAKQFNKAGVPAVAVWGDSSPADRKAALQDLAAGGIRVVFSVDLFNEGVDVPAVDTVLMLRPTESPTLFLQQLGRGLRRSKGKTFCTVLDFVGTHRREFRFDRRYRALIGGTRREIEQAVQQGFPFLPAGCYVHLDEKASEIVLRSLREALPARWPARVEELRVVHAEYPDVTLSKYLKESGLDLPDVYDGSRGWSDLCEAAGVPIEPAGQRRSRCARRSAVCCTSTTTSASPLTGDSSSRQPRLTFPKCRNVSDASSACSSPAWATKCSPRTTRCRTLSISYGHTRRYAPSSPSSSSSLTTGSTTSTASLTIIPMFRCRYTPATRVSRSLPPSASAPTSRSPLGRAACTKPRAPMPSCSPSR